MPPEKPADAELHATVVRALQRLLQHGDSESAMRAVLGDLGKACGTDRVHVSERHSLPDHSDRKWITRRFEWVAGGIVPQTDNPRLRNLSLETLLPRWLRVLDEGGMIHGPVRGFPASERSILEPQGIMSTAIAPIMIEDECWGLVGFDQCSRPREWDEATLSMLKEAAAGIGNAVLISRSTKALQKANAELEKQAEELRTGRRVALSLMEDAKQAGEAAARANEAKTRFLAFLSHEIRTPLHGILGFSELLLNETGIPGPALEKIRNIQSGSEVMVALVDDMLELSRIESGTIDIENSDGDIRRTAESVVAAFRAQVEIAGLEIRLEIDDAFPPVLNMDHRRYAQVLNNLVGNAVKFTAAGGVRISITWRDAPAAGKPGKVLTSVKDTGRGIEPAAAAHVFDTFWRGMEAPLHGMPSTGLGLAISKNLCKRLGGDISFTSTPGTGSDFRFWLPARPGSAQPETAPRSASGAGHLADSVPLRVLVVDDVKTNRDLLAGMLGRLGYKPITASGGEEALRHVSENPFDLIFMDVLMPGMDGCETARRIRKDEAADAMPPCRIVALSADAMSDNRTRCLAAGMDQFLTKPLRMENLVASIRTASDGQGPFPKERKLL